MAAAGVNWVVGQTYSESPARWLEAVQLCLEIGGDVNAVNDMGLAAMHGAANRGSDDIIELLAKRGAQLDKADKEGRTPMVWAEGVFLATNSPVAKPSTMALLKRLLADALRRARHRVRRSLAGLTRPAPLKRRQSRPTTPAPPRLRTERHDERSALFIAAWCSAAR